MNRIFATALAAVLGALVVTLSLTVPASAAESDNGPGRLMLVLDSSGSMKEPAAGGQTKIAAAKEALRTVVAGLPDDQPVGMRVYGAKVFSKGDQGACTDSQRAVDIGTDNRPKLLDAIDSYKPYGETPIGYSLQQAGKDLGPEGQRTIVLVSDGEPTCAPDPCEVAKDLAKDGIELKIDVVGLDVSGKARAILQCIAKEGRGTYYDADSADSLASALDKVSERAARPYETIGKPVDGTPTTEAAPAIGAGDWLDRLGSTEGVNQELNYRVERETPGSTLHFSATFTRERTDKDYDTLYVQARGDGGASCGVASGLGDRYGTLLTIGSLSVPGPNADPSCSTSDSITFTVGRGRDDTPVTWAGKPEVPLELRVIEEPPVKTATTGSGIVPKATYVAPTSTAGGQKIVGGSSFADAPTLTDGTYTGTLVPGETQIFFMDVDWGQHLNVTTTFPKPEGALEKVVSKSASADTQLLGPGRGSVVDTAEGATARQVFLNGQDSTNGIASVPVTYAGRTSPHEEDQAASLAGQYAIAVTLAPDEDTDVSYERPFTLTASVDGEVSGTPDYVEPASKKSAGTSDDDTKNASAETDDDSSLPVLPIGLGVLGAAVLGAAVLVLQRSRVN